MNNNDFKQDEVVLVDLGYKELIVCKVITRVKPGYTKLIVEDIEADKVKTSTINRTWRKYVRKNHGRGLKHIVHVNRVKKWESN